MIEKLNFYDVYGYLLPGLVLVGGIWLPFGIVEHSFPDLSVAFAVGLLLLSYLAGHLLQTFAARVMPSDIMTDAAGQNRYPSDLMVDASDSTFTPEFKKQLEQLVRKQFELEIDVNASLATTPSNSANLLAKNRNQAFFLCRNYLKQHKFSYAEQFEGMYAFARGCAAATVVASFYALGCALHLTIRSAWALVLGVVVSVCALAVAVALNVRILRESGRDRNRSRYDGPLAAAALLSTVALGYLSAPTAESFTRGVIEICLLVLILCLVSARFYGAYEYFAKEFAKSIWRDYATLTEGKERKSKPKFE